MGDGTSSRCRVTVPFGYSYLVIGYFAELHCHSYYSFHDGASSLEELLVRAKELGYRALALTDHDNLCAAMRFAQLADSLEIQGIIGAEVTLTGGSHITLLAK